MEINLDNISHHVKEEYTIHKYDSRKENLYKDNVSDVSNEEELGQDAHNDDLIN